MSGPQSFLQIMEKLGEMTGSGRTFPIDYTLRKSKFFFNPNMVIHEKDAGEPGEK